MSGIADDAAMSPLDVAFIEMAAAGDDPIAAARFHERLLAGWLSVVLAAEPEQGAEAVRPEVFDVEEGRFVLAFDSDGRMAAFLDRARPSAGLSGRSLIAMLAGRGLGIALNLGEAPSATLLPAETIDWLADRLREAALVEIDTGLDWVGPPLDAPAALIDGLGRRITAFGPTIGMAVLVASRSGDAEPALTLAVSGAPEAARAAIAAAVAEAAAICGPHDRAVQVFFVDRDLAVLARLERVGIVFEVAAALEAPPAGSDNGARPPILR